MGCYSPVGSLISVVSVVLLSNVELTILSVYKCVRACVGVRMRVLVGRYVCTYVRVSVLIPGKY